MNSVSSLVFLITRFVVTNVCTRAGFCDFCKKEICWKVFNTTYDIIWQINLKEGMLVWFRCCLNFRHFPEFKKNYPFYPCLVVGDKRARYHFSPLPTIRFLILKIILFSKIMLWLWLKLRQGLELWKDRKRIKISEWWENIVWLVK